MVALDTELPQNLEPFPAVDSVLAQASALINEGWLDSLAPCDHLSEYWERMLSDHPEHPLAREPAKWKVAIPIALWGDEGTQGRSSWMLSSWCLGWFILDNCLTCCNRASTA